MPARLILLLGALAAALLLFRRSRTPEGAAEVDAVVGGALEFIDVNVERIKARATSRGYRNNNPGNIRYLEKNAWNGQIASDGAFGIYETPALGTRALGRQLLVYAKRGLVTVRDIIATWAPPVGRDPATGANYTQNTVAYIAAVARELGVDPDARLDVYARLPELARAIAHHENGYVDDSYDFHAWVYL